MKHERVFSFTMWFLIWAVFTKFMGSLGLILGFILGYFITDIIVEYIKDYEKKKSERQ